MDTGKRQHLQDIYATDHTKRDDYTPQISNEIVEERKREVRRHKFTGFVLGMTILVLLVALVYLVVREYIDIITDTAPPTPITREYIPRHSLPTESQWVLDVHRNYGNPAWDGEGERPFNTEWIKKAAHNIVYAEKAYEIARGDDAALADAARYYEQALEILPDLEGVKVPLGLVYFRMGEFNKALALLENAPERDLTFDILNNLGAACIEAEAFERAEEYLKRSLELKPAYAEAHGNLARLYKKLERPEEAIKAYEEFLDQRPLDSVTRYDFALYLTKIGRWKLAAEQLRELTDQITNDHTMYILLARVEAKLGNAEAATEALRRGIRLVDPELAIVWMNDTDFDQFRTTEDFQALMKYIQKDR